MTATWVDGGYLLGTAEGAFKTNVASGAQGGLFFGFSLIVGGVFFARRMRTLPGYLPPRSQGVRWDGIGGR